MQRFLYSLLFFWVMAVVPFTQNQVKAQSSELSAAYRFLNLTASPRAAALGGNQVAIPDADVSFFDVNPGYVTEELHRNFSVNYLNHIGGLDMGFVNGAWHLRDIGTLGVGIRYLNYGEMQRTDESGIVTGDFNAGDLAFTTGITREWFEGLHAGASVSLIYSSYAEYSSTAIGLNLGARYYFEDLGLHVGAAVLNIGSQLSAFDTRREKLPLDVRVGISRRLEYIPIRLMVTAHSLNRWKLETQNDVDPGFTEYFFRHLKFGGELLLSENVMLRAGYDHLKHQELKTSNRLDSAGFSYGLGIRYRGITFDFSRSSFSELGGVTRIGIQTWL